MSMASAASANAIVVRFVKNTGFGGIHAGTKLAGADLVTSGGRVLGITASGAPLASAIDGAYRGVHKISFDGMHYRTDIGRKGLTRTARL